MRFCSPLLLLLGAATFSPLRALDVYAQSAVIHESRNMAPRGYYSSGPAPSDVIMDLQIALLPSDIEGLRVAMTNISTPGSHSYGQHLSKQQVDTHLAPKAQSVTAVREFLSAYNITATSNSLGDMHSFSAPVSLVAKMFNANLSIFTHQKSGKTQIRTTQYSVSQTLADHVDFVHPLLSFNDFDSNRPATAQIPVPISYRRGEASSVPEDCKSLITPACLQALYGIPSAPTGNKNVTMYVLGYADYYADRVDLQSFLKATRPDIDPNTTWTEKYLDGGQNPQDPSEAATEPSLDLQYTIGLSTGVPVTFLSVGLSNSPNGSFQFFQDTTTYLLGLEDPPSVVSTSYGFDEDLVSQKWAHKTCDYYMALGARGITMIFGSGDGGATGLFIDETCGTAQPGFPGGCPYITSVGGTTSFAPEVATNFSSGGFSNYFSKPSYQTSFVDSYIASHPVLYAGLYNATGRAFPDIAAQSLNFEIWVGGNQTTIWGTSCSGPVVSSMIALLDGELMSAGKKQLGWLNPWIYANPDIWTDITEGKNPGPNCTEGGWETAKGWDPITGLGTPSYPAMRKAAGL